MLDYAANAVAYWPVEEIKAKFESRCKDDGDDPETELVGLLGEGQDTSSFWQSVKTNLQAGRVRLLFIADEIPTELRRVVEFLNSQMDPAEVLAIEVKQFVGENLKTLVPRVVGQTETARQKKKVERGESRQWDEASFFSERVNDGVNKRRRSPGDFSTGRRTTVSVFGGVKARKMDRSFRRTSTGSDSTYSSPSGPTGVSSFNFNT